MNKKMLKARIRVLESDAAHWRELAYRRTHQVDELTYALDRVGGICALISARAIASDEGAVGEFAWITITTPTTLMLAQICKDAMEKSLAADVEAAKP